MRMMFVIVIGLTLMAIISVSWYVSNILFVGLSTVMTVEGSALSTMNLIGYVNIVWGPVFVVLVLLWMIASAQARDVESDIYG